VKLAHVRGRITRLWGEPVKQAQVSFYKLQGINGISPTEELISAVSTDNDGNYKADVPGGQYRVAIKGRGWERAEVWRYYLGDSDDRVLDIGAPQGNWRIVSRMNAATITFAPVCSSLGLLKSKALPGNPATTKTPAEQPSATNKGGCFL
jgi:hypothetical protein